MSFNITPPVVKSRLVVKTDTGVQRSAPRRDRVYAELLQAVNEGHVILRLVARRVL